MKKTILRPQNLLFSKDKGGFQIDIKEDKAPGSLTIGVRDVYSSLGQLKLSPGCHQSKDSSVLFSFFDQLNLLLGEAFDLSNWKEVEFSYINLREFKDSIVAPQLIRNSLKLDGQSFVDKKQKKTAC